MSESVEAVVKAIRTALAAAIRDRAADICAQAEAIADVPTGAGVDHPFMLGMEFAAQIVESEREQGFQTSKGLS